MQVVKGVSPTISGLRLVPLMAGLLLTSITSGILISRWGRYKVFPILGTALMTVGMYLLSMLGVSTGTLASSVYMFVLGAGIGLVMQVLIIAVQNVVPYGDLGAATSGATFFRSIGGSFGTAVFGAIFSAQLGGNLRHYLAGQADPGRLQPVRGQQPGRAGQAAPGGAPRVPGGVLDLAAHRVPGGRADLRGRVRPELAAQRGSAAPDQYRVQPRAEPGPHRGAGRVHLPGRDGAGAQRPGQRAEPGAHLRAPRRPGRGHDRRGRVLDAAPGSRASRGRRCGAQ